MRQARPIPDDWAPNKKHAQQAQEKRADLGFEATRFRNHARTNDRRVRDWDAAFRNWLTKAQPSQRQTQEPVSVWDGQYQRGPE